MSNAANGFKRYPLLLPLAALYGAVVWCRNWLYDLGWLKSQSFDLPVIAVGNLAVGGTGKTPHVEYLLRLLCHRLKTAMLSRGYGRATRGFLIANESSTAATIGDEPLQIACKFDNAIVAVDEDRCEGIRMLRIASPELEAVVLDDALQHRAVNPGLSILLTDYSRPYFDDWLLPAGRLREQPSGKWRADIIVVTKCPAELSRQEAEELHGKLGADKSQEVYFTTFRYGECYNLTTRQNDDGILDGRTSIVAVTGIANPALFIERICSMTGKNPLHFNFPDHHNYTPSDMKIIAECYKAQAALAPTAIVTTEKDAARLQSTPGLPNEVKRNIYVLPIEVCFLFNEADNFNNKIISYVEKNRRNGQMA